jgi:heme-degrading monooxygenase HmoA
METPVILELVDLQILPGQHDAFEAALQEGLSTIIARSAGCRGWQVHRGIESAHRYVIQIWWDTLEDHTVGFRGSEAFGRWRALVGPFFAAPPAVEHFTLGEGQTPT